MRKRKKKVKTKTAHTNYVIFTTIFWALQCWKNLSVSSPRRMKLDIYSLTL